MRKAEFAVVQGQGNAVASNVGFVKLVVEGEGYEDTLTSPVVAEFEHWLHARLFPRCRIEQVFNDD